MSRLFCLFILSIFFIANNAFGLACSSNATGNWSNSGSWTSCGGGVPASGDTVTISGHTITVDTNTTVGNSPAAGGIVVTVQSSGVLTVASSVLFTVKGGIALNDTVMNMSAGSTLEFDASGAGSPSTATYPLQIGTAGFQTNARLNINGSAGSRVTIRSKSGSANGYITDTSFSRAGMITGTYFDMLRIGDSTNPAMQFSATGSGQNWSITNCICDTCGEIRTGFAFAADANVTIQNCTWKSTAATLSNYLQSSTYTSGTRLYDGNVMDKDVTFSSGSGWTITNSLFNASITTANGNWVSFDNNLLRFTGSGGPNIGGNVTNSYILSDSANTNVTFLSALVYPFDMSITGNVFEHTGTDGTGDAISLSNPSSAKTASISNNLILKNGGSDNSGACVTSGGGANTTFNYNHNTCYTGTQGSIVGLSYAGRSGLLTSFKSNIFWDDSAGRGYKLFDSGVNDSVTDLVASADANYNTGYNLQAGSNLKGYNNLEFSSGSPGANDIDTDPTFVDATRRVATWDTFLGGAGTVANALTELRKKNDTSGYNSSYNIAALVLWVRGGFKVTASSLNNAGHDGVTIGCCGFQGSGGSSGNLLLLKVG